jgi:hypothetical protein
LARRRRVAVADLRDERFVDCHRDWTIRVIADRILAAAGIEHVPSIVVNDVPFLLGFVEQGLGVALVPRVVSRFPARAVRQAQPETAGVAARRGVRPSGAAARALLGMLPRPGVADGNPASTEVEAGIRTLVLCQALLHEASLMATIRVHHEDVEVEGCRQPRRRPLLLRGEIALHILEAAAMYIRKDQSVAVGIHQPVAAEVPSPSVAATRFPQDQALPLGHAANPVLSHFVGRFWHNKLTTTLRG